MAATRNTSDADDISMKIYYLLRSRENVKVLHLISEEKLYSEIS